MSASQVNMYMRCAAQWMFRYIEGLIIPPSGAMTRGNAFHAGTYQNFNQKIERYQDMPEDDVLDVYSTTYDSLAHKTEWKDGEDKGAIKDSGVELMKQYHNAVSPTIQPVQAEFPFILEMDNKDWTFNGVVDVLTETGRVIENKTTGRGLKTPRSSHLLQSTAYSVGANSRQAEIVYAVSKKEPEMLRFPVAITMGMINYFLTIIAQVAHAIESEVFPPHREDNFLCSRRYCGYWNVCEKKFGGYIKD